MYRKHRNIWKYMETYENSGNLVCVVPCAHFNAFKSSLLEWQLARHCVL